LSAPDLSGRTALVSGAAGGIGRAIARALAAAGARVGVCDVQESVHATAESLRTEGAQAVSAIVDVASRGAVHEGVATLARSLGPIDVLVSAAAIVDHIASFGTMDPARFEREVAVNLGGTFHLAQAVLPAMVERRFGRVIAIASLAARGGLGRQAGYAASKAGLVGLVETIAIEHARDGITANAILPGLIETEKVAAMPPEIRDAAVRGVPIRRLGAMQEVAALVAFLASDAAGFITGASIPIDGGASLNAMTLGSRREVRERG
jgi:NAD(P)-dependent dehydrogenase (short-subunit alcohol dehydrogenase family)